MNPLAFLLGQQSAVDMAEQPVNEILVKNWSPEDMPRQGLPDENYTLDNSRDIQMRDEALRRGEEVSDRRGMFGMKGTLRDVVGVLGDAFLMQSGNNPIYAPTRQQERFSDAMAGAGRDPMGAYERAMGVAPSAAQDFYKDYQTQQAARVRNQIDQDTLNQRVAEDAMKLSSQMMAAAVASGNPQRIEEAKAGIGILAERAGVPVETLLAGGDPSLIAGRGATSYQNFRLPQQERALDQGEERIAIALRNARTAEGRLAVAEQMLGLRRDSEAFKQEMKRLGYELDVKEEEGRNNRANARGARDNDTAPSGGGWKIRPRSQ